VGVTTHRTAAQAVLATPGRGFLPGVAFGVGLIAATGDVEEMARGPGE
jgi:hypothetical protein